MINLINGHLQDRTGCKGVWIEGGEGTGKSSSFFILQMLIELKHFFWYVDCDLTCDDYFSLHH